MVGAIFDEKERENPGRIYGLPKESVFQGVDEEVEALLAAQGHGHKPETSAGAAINGAASSSSTASSTTVTTNGTHTGLAARNHYLHANGNGNLKGKERARSDAMDIG